MGWFPGCFKGQIVMGRMLGKRRREKSKGSWENYMAFPWKDLDRERWGEHSGSPLPATTKESSSSWAFGVGGRMVLWPQLDCHGRRWSWEGGRRETGSSPPCKNRKTEREKDRDTRGSRPLKVLLHDFSKSLCLIPRAALTTNLMA